MADRPKVAVVGAGKSTHSSQSNSEAQAKNFIRRVGIRSFEKYTRRRFRRNCILKRRTMLVGYGISQMIQIPPLPQNAGPSQAMFENCWVANSWIVMTWNSCSQMVSESTVNHART
jgi:hypothetical protein